MLRHGRMNGDYGLTPDGLGKESLPATASTQSRRSQRK